MHSTHVDLAWTYSLDIDGPALNSSSMIEGCRTRGKSRKKWTSCIAWSDSIPRPLRVDGSVACPLGVFWRLQLHSYQGAFTSEACVSALLQIRNEEPEWTFFPSYSPVAKWIMDGRSYLAKLYSWVGGVSKLHHFIVPPDMNAYKEYRTGPNTSFQLVDTKIENFSTGKQIY